MTSVHKPLGSIPSDYNTQTKHKCNVVENLTNQEVTWGPTEQGYLNSAEKAGSVFHLASRTLGVPIDSTRSGELIWRHSWSRLTGVQEVTRRFYCWGCFSTVCDLPLDCPGEVAAQARQGRGGACVGPPESLFLSSPVQDVTVKRGDQALFSCIVGFQLPESELTYSWKFAGGGVSRDRACRRA